jgi:signal peptidase I
MDRLKRYFTAENIKSIAFALLIAFIFRSFAFEAYEIPSSSMEPTLLVGDRLFVSKYAYGYSKYSILGTAYLDSFFDLPVAKERLWFTPPKRGDIIVFKLKKPDMIFIKRLIGLPGDKIQFINGELFLNQQKVAKNGDAPYQFVERDSHSRYNLRQYNELLPESKPHAIVEVNRMGENLANLTTPVIVVPQNHYFFMGDNRDFSNDSRFAAMGMVPEESFIGRAETMFWTASVLQNLISFKLDPRWFMRLRYD